MPPQIATVVFAILIGGLFWLDRSTKKKVSIALWLPVIWMFFAASRNLGEWLQFGTPMEAGGGYTEGNALDRNFLTALIGVSVVVLIARHRQVVSILRKNAPILGYFAYTAVSTLWSDSPDVSAKRWVRSVGDLVIVLIVLTDSNPSLALRKLLNRLGFVLMPVSILLIRWYPMVGRSYSRWTGALSWTGVSTGKNGLGLLCLILGVASVWRVLHCLKDRDESHRKGIFIAHGSMIIVALWLIYKANSMTSYACLILVSTVMFLVSRKNVDRKPVWIHIIVWTTIVCAFCALFFGVGLSSLGRDSTLTGRTDIWNLVLGMVSNPLIGTGFESFWLGERLEAIRKLYPNHVNQSHNGYIEVYINLGWIGVALLLTLLATGYKRIIKAVCRREDGGDIKLAFFMIAIIYNFTEASFKMTGFAWLALLLAAVVVPRTAGGMGKTKPEIKPPTHYRWAEQARTGAASVWEKAL